MLEKEPFVRYDLDKDIKDKAIFTVRFNKDERIRLDKLKELLNIQNDSTALKMGAEIGLNVLLQTFGESNLKWLFKKDRTKLEDYKNF